MRASAFALVLAAAFTAGCGGHGRSAEPNSEASKPADSVLADANRAATKASSVHVSGNIVSSGMPITLDLVMARDNGAKGSMTIMSPPQPGQGFMVVPPLPAAGRGRPNPPS